MFGRRQYARTCMRTIHVTVRNTAATTYVRMYIHCVVEAAGYFCFTGSYNILFESLISRNVLLVHVACMWLAFNLYVACR